MGWISHSVKRVIKAIRIALATKTWNRKLLLLKYHYPLEINIGKTHVHFSVLQIEIAHGTCQHVLDGYEILRSLKIYRSAVFKIQDNDFYIEIGSVILSPATAEELFIANEIFLRGVYNFQSTTRSIVIDIGLNVGLASLFFASRPEVEKVFAFEPFVPTFERALININNNRSLCDKISCFNFGLGERDESLTVAYNYNNKGQVGIYGTALIRSEIDVAQKETINIKDASEQIGQILAANPLHDVIMKVDCEGAEYGIIDNLSKSKVLDRINIIFIEWHEIGPDPLLKTLSSSNFTSFYQYEANQKVGMIYAKR